VTRLLPLSAAGLVAAALALANRDARADLTDLAQTEDRSRGLDDQRQDAASRLAASRDVLAQVAAGDLPLAAAAAELEALFGGWADYLAGLRAYYPGATDRERFARSLVDRVRCLEDRAPGRHAAAVARVEAELAALYPASR
jgi:hypothetical protein